MPDSDRLRLRTTFGQAAALYDRSRPGYPPELFDDLAHLAHIGSGSQVLEIGCGTGQAHHKLEALLACIAGLIDTARWADRNR